jgi:hypothetical protein
MNVSRRQLLKGIGAIAASRTLSPLSAISLDNNSYRNSRLGLSLQKPDDWHFVSITDFTKALDKLSCSPKFGPGIKV